MNGRAALLDGMRGACLLVLLASTACQSKSSARVGGGGGEATGLDSGTAARAVLVDARETADVGDVPESGGRGSSIWSGESGGVRIDWATDGLWARVEGGKSFELFERPKVETGCEGDQTLRVLSVVGPIVSYELSEGWMCEGAAHPSGITLYSAVDAAHPCPSAPCAVEQRPSLADLFPDADLVRALKADPIVRRQLPSAVSRTTKDLVKELAASNPECEYAFQPDLLNRFAFHHVEGNRVAVRIGLSHGCEVARGMLTQLGILLPIPPRLKVALDRASTRAEGFLMRELPLVSNGQKTSIHY